MLDVRGLPPPEPFERIMQALQEQDALHVLIHREPYPLYEVLKESGYFWQTRALADGNYEILICK